MTFLTYNILDGGHGREGALCEIIAAQDADIVLLQEVMDTKPVSALAERCGYEFFVAESNSQRTLALLSRLPIRKATSFHPPILRHTCLHAALEVAFNRTVTLFGIHLAAPAYTFPVEVYRLFEWRAIHRQIAESDAEMCVLAGDFNSFAPGDKVDLDGLPWKVRASVILQGGLSARQVIGSIRRAGFVDCFREMHPSGNGFTLPPEMPRVRLDYFFVNQVLCPRLRACEVVVEPGTVKGASDHLPVRMELDLI